jgi:putative membrane protein
MENMWENEYVYIAARYSVVILCMIVFLAIFELVTKYKNWEEIKQGNLSVALATGGKIFGIAYVFQQSILHHWLGRLRFCPAVDRLFHF